MDDFTEHYLIAALWSSADDDEEPLDFNYGIEQLAPEAIDRAKADCADFQTKNASLLNQAYKLYTPHIDAPTPQCSAGHDFWLTRNGHGVGFWDRGFPDALGDALSDAARACGELDLYAGDDGKLYFS